MSRGILRNCRLEFALHVVHKMYPKQITHEVCSFNKSQSVPKMIDFKEWKLFLGNAAHFNREDTGGIPLWIPDQYKTNAKMFQVLKAFVPKKLVSY